jgi:hypothetical protein
MPAAGRFSVIVTAAVVKRAADRSGYPATGNLPKIGARCLSIRQKIRPNGERERRGPGWHGPCFVEEDHGQAPAGPEPA